MPPLLVKRTGFTPWISIFRYCLDTISECGILLPLFHSRFQMLRKNKKGLDQVGAQLLFLQMFCALRATSSLRPVVPSSRRVAGRGGYGSLDLAYPRNPTRTP